MASATFSTLLGGDGSSVNDDGSVPAASLLDGGHKSLLVPALSNIVNIASKAKAAIAGASGSDPVPAFFADGFTMLLALPVVTYGEQTIDTRLLTAGTRVWLNAQANPAENGPYVVQPDSWIRPVDGRESAQYFDGRMLFAYEVGFGLAQQVKFGPSLWRLSVPSNFVLGVGAISAAPASPQGMDTLWVPASKFAPRLIAGPSIGTAELPASKTVLKSLDFDPSTVEYAQAIVQIPERYVDPSGGIRVYVTAELVWTAASSFGTVFWRYSASYVKEAFALSGSVNGLNPASFGNTTDVVPANTLKKTQPVRLFGANSGAATTALAIEVFRLATDPFDTFSGDAKMLGLILKFQTSANND